MIHNFHYFLLVSGDLSYFSWLCSDEALLLSSLLMCFRESVLFQNENREPKMLSLLGAAVLFYAMKRE